MNCLSELQYSIYVDGELAPEEARRVELHLLVCPRCRTLVESLQEEASLLTQIFQTTPAEGFEPATGPRSALGLLGAFLGMVGVALGVVTVSTWAWREFLGSYPVLDPLNRTTLMSVFMNAALYLSREGAAIFYSFITTLGALLLGLLLLTGLRLLLRRYTVSVSALAGVGWLSLLLGLASPASAIEHRGGQLVTVPAGQTIDQSLVAAGDQVSIEGNVNGDLVLYCRRSVIKGNVKGNVFNFSQNLEIDGTVDGSVYSFSRDVTLRGRVTRGFGAFAATVNVQRTGQVDGDAYTFTGDLTLAGNVGRDLEAQIGGAELSGQVGRNVHIHADRPLTVLSSARIGGNLDAEVTNKELLRIENGAVVAGKTDVRLIKKAPSRYQQLRFYFWQAVWLLALLLTGFILFLLFPGLFRGRIDNARSVLLAGGVGFLVLIVTPIAAIIACITLVGLPLGLLTLVLWIAALFLAKLFVAAAVGQQILGPGRDGKASFASALLLGLVIVVVSKNLPYVGGVIAFLILLLGLGLAARQIAAYWRRPATV